MIPSEKQEEMSVSAINASQVGNPEFDSNYRRMSMTLPEKLLLDPVEKFEKYSRWGMR